MSVAERPFSDTRNMYIVNNDAADAFDKSFAGIPGTHPEQRCCRDRAPFMGPTYRKGLSMQPWSQAQVDKYYRDEGSYPFYKHGEELWCHECSTGLETAWSDFLDVLSDTVPVVRGIAMAASYIPVFGTAVSFIINTSVTLAETGEIDSALLDGIGGAIPGQPASGMVFNTVRAVARGDRIDKVAIAALPLDPSAKKLIGTACDIITDIADGKRIDNIVLTQVKQALPPSGQKLMDLGRSLANGEDIPEIVLRAADAATSIPGSGSVQAAREFRAAALAAKANGEVAVERFVAQVGFTGTLVGLPPDIRRAMMAGAIGGMTENEHFVIPFGSVAETNVPVNDSYEDKGRKIIAAGAKWRGRLLSDMLKGSRLKLTVDFYDSLIGAWTKRAVTYEITPAWRRGFMVATGACEGSSQRGPGQTAVYQTMAEAGGRAGFDAGQAIAHQRFGMGRKESVTAEGGVTAEGVKTVAIAKSDVKAVAIAKSAFGMGKKESVTAEDVKAVAIAESDVKAVAIAKSAERTAWVAHYKRLGGP